MLFPQRKTRMPSLSVGVINLFYKEIRFMIAVFRTDSSMDRVPGFEPGGWRFEPSSVQIFWLLQTSKP